MLIPLASGYSGDFAVDYAGLAGVCFLYVLGFFLQLFWGMLQRCFAVKLQTCFPDFIRLSNIMDSD